jgi:hypothetical protein
MHRARRRRGAIDLAAAPRRVDSNSTAGGDQAFSWIGATAFTGVAGQFRVFQSDRRRGYGRRQHRRSVDHSHRARRSSIRRRIRATRCNRVIYHRLTPRTEVKQGRMGAVAGAMLARKSSSTTDRHDHRYRRPRQPHQRSDVGSTRWIEGDTDGDGGRRFRVHVPDHRPARTDRLPALAAGAPVSRAPKPYWTCGGGGKSLRDKGKSGGRSSPASRSARH